MSDQEHIHEPDIAQVYVKLARATRSMTPVAKTMEADTGKYKYRYATLADTLEAVNEALHAEGLVLLQPVYHEDEYMVLTCVIVDEATGLSLTFPGATFKIMNDPQGVGSAISYGRRYALTSLFGLVVEDDDGAYAQRAVTKPGQRTEAERQVRDFVRTLNDDDRAAFMEQFKEAFGSTLTALPESRHGDALTWQREWAMEHDS